MKGLLLVQHFIRSVWRQAGFLREFAHLYKFMTISRNLQADPLHHPRYDGITAGIVTPQTV
jgi:hypothetical protein